MFAGVDDRVFNQVAYDLFDVTANVADLGKLRRFDLNERSAGQLCQSTRDLGFTNASRSDHQDVLWINLVTQIIAKLLAPPTVAQGHSNGAFRVVLADDVTIKFRDNLAGGQVCHVSPLDVGRW